MKIEKITIRYSTTIPIAQYGVNDKVDAEITVTEGENGQLLHETDIDRIIPAIKKRVDDTVRREYPNMYSNGASAMSLPEMKVTHWQSPQSTVTDVTNSFTNQKLSPKDNYLLEINQCTNTESLKALRFLAKTLKVEADKKEVEKAYETKLAELTKQKTTA